MFTSIDAYKDRVFPRLEEQPRRYAADVYAPLWVARRRAATDGFTLIEGSCFAASSAGTANRVDYVTMRDEVLDQVKAAVPLDGVLPRLRGAMVAHCYDDTEGDVVERVRALAGPKCVIDEEFVPCVAKRRRNPCRSTMAFPPPWPSAARRW
jgi:microcystin degradation protein MlrC